jgi:phage tail sheath protein FI
MPEYLSPGVYVEEVPSTPTIQGVSTTVTGFIGPTRYGPYLGDPQPLTGYLDFSRIYGGADQMNFANSSLGPTDNYLALAVQAFFNNGGTVLYVTRVVDTSTATLASTTLGSLPGATLQARFPGAAGNMKITFAVKTSPNVLVSTSAGPQLRGALPNDLVYLKPSTTSIPTAISAGLYDVVASSTGVLSLQAPGGGPVHQLVDLIPGTMRVHRVTLSVLTLRVGMFETEQSWPNLYPSPKAAGSITSYFTQTPTSTELQQIVPFVIVPPGVTPVAPGASAAQSAAIYAPYTGSDVLAWLFPPSFISTTLPDSLETPLELALAHQTAPGPAAMQVTYTLAGGTDGNVPGLVAYSGTPAARDPITNVYAPASGLASFADIDEISIVAAPGSSVDYSNSGNAITAVEIAQALIEHCEIVMKYRVALLDSPNGYVVSDIQKYRGQFDSSYAALYYPWLKISDPTDLTGQREIIVPPSGFVAGICARSDITNGVSKAPANEIPMGALDVELLINTAQQSILNPIGVNCFRPFTNRGIRLWGARTISSDTSWTYLSTRRYFNYVEHSIDNGTQWVVFEKNDDRTWFNVVTSVYDFLYNEWMNEALLGTSAAQAFFVKCDRTTMSATDRASGRLICNVGISIIFPAEFVIFRIGQLTASATP